MAVDHFLKRSLTHEVDIRQSIGLDSDGNETYQFLSRVGCLVDSASGRRRDITNQGDTQSYDFGITFSGDGFEPKIGMQLLDARDEEDAQIFEKALIKIVRAYREIGKGVVGYLVLANSRE